VIEETPMHVADRFRLVFLGLLLLAIPERSAAEEKRVALVIGNSAYRQTAQLKNPGNDAADMAASLRTLGFRVIEGIDLDKLSMDGKISEFAEALPGADSGVFFYAGHGLQVSGRNYLMPVDARLTTAAALDLEMVQLDVVQRAMERVAKFNVLFVDACRDNPLADTLAGAMGMRPAEMARGLAPSRSNLGSLISFSTQPGNVALDGIGRNSPFASALLKRIAAPGDDLSTILINVRNDVVRATAARQIPWEHSSLWSRFYFTAPVSPGPAQVASATPTPEQQRETALWNSMRDGGKQAVLRTYLDRYPDGAFADLARMYIARLERWEADDARPRLDRGQPINQDSVWRVPRLGEAGVTDCRRLYAVLSARVQEANLQCGTQRRSWYR
jgi:uncharacterized caspase-like protein